MPLLSDRPLSRRTALAQFGAAFVAAPAVLRGRYRLFAGDATEYSARCIKLMDESIVVDLLNQFRFADYSETPPHIDRWLREPGSLAATDGDAYVGSKMTAVALGQVPSTYALAVRFMGEWNGLIDQYPKWFTHIVSVNDFARAKAANKLGIMITGQDSRHFRTLDDVSTFWGLGQRISQLTYNTTTTIGSGFLSDRDSGLTPYGVSLVERMNQVGMAVDVSHCADKTTMDALNASKRPVLITHANCRALAPSLLRLKTDEAIRAMAKTGGVMGVTFLRFAVREQEPVTIEHLLDHVDYSAKLVGVEHVAVGSDIDMVGNAQPVGGGGDPTTQHNFDRYRYHTDPNGKLTIAGLDHPKRMFDLADGLISRRYSDADIALILGGNAVRVLSDIWRGG